MSVAHGGAHAHKKLAKKLYSGLKLCGVISAELRQILRGGEALYAVGCASIVAARGHDVLKTSKMQPEFPGKGARRGALHRYYAHAGNRGRYLRLLYHEQKRSLEWTLRILAGVGITIAAAPSGPAAPLIGLAGGGVAKKIIRRAVNECWPRIQEQERRFFHSAWRARTHSRDRSAHDAMKELHRTWDELHRCLQSAARRLRAH